MTPSDTPHWLDALADRTPLQRWLLEAGEKARIANSASRFDLSTEAGGQPKKRAGVIR